MSVRTAEDLTDGKITPCVCRANRCSADTIHIAHALAVRTSNFISLGRCAALAAKTKQLIIAPLLDRPAQNSRLPGVRAPEITICSCLCNRCILFDFSVPVIQRIERGFLNSSPSLFARRLLQYTDHSFPSPLFFHSTFDVRRSVHAAP